MKELTIRNEVAVALDTTPGSDLHTSIPFEPKTLVARVAKLARCGDPIGHQEVLVCEQDSVEVGGEIQHRLCLRQSCAAAIKPESADVSQHRPC